MGSTADKVTGYLEVGTNGCGEVVINHGDLAPDEHGVGHIVFSPNQARELASLLSKSARLAETETRLRVRPSKAKLRHNGTPYTY